MNEWKIEIIILMSLKIYNQPQETMCCIANVIKLTGGSIESGG